MLSVSGCSVDAKNPDGSETTKKVQPKSDSEGVITADIDPDSDVTLLIEASSDSNISKAKVLVPPGSINEPTEMTIEEGVPLEKTEDLSELGFGEDENKILGQGAVVVVTLNPLVDIQKPFKIILPLPDESGLNLADKNYAVLYKTIVSDSEFKMGILPPGQFTFNDDGLIVVEASFIGSFQVVEVKNPQEEDTSVDSDTGFTTKRTQEIKLNDFNFEMFEDENRELVIPYTDAIGETCSVTPNGQVTVVEDCSCQDFVCSAIIVGSNNYNGSASANVTVSDGQSEASATVSITINPVDDNSIMATNTGLTLTEDGTSTITSAMFNATDIDEGASDIIFTVSQVPNQGDLEKSTVALSVGQTFTQDDINNSLMTYKSTGADGADQFKVTLDGQTITFNITVNSFCISHSAATTYNEIPLGPEFVLCTSDQVADFAQHCSANACSQTFRLRDNVDMNGVSTVPAGNPTFPFAGTFKGDGHTLTDFGYSAAVNNGGFFGQTNGATIENLTLSNVNISTDDSTGGMVGRAISTTITNCHVTGTVSGALYTGGFVGFADNSVISNSSSLANVTTSSTVAGGFIGWAMVNGAPLTINNNFATGTVNGTGVVGGFFGQATSGEAAPTVNISQNYATGNVTITGATTSNAGGFVGLVTVDMDRNWASGSVSDTGGTNHVGGFVGEVATGSMTPTITRSYATGNITGSGANAGGFAGFIDGATISDSYATGTVVGVTTAGGFAGKIGSATNGAQIDRIYVTGMPSGATNVGAFAGDIDTTNSPAFTSSFYNNSNGLPAEGQGSQSITNVSYADNTQMQTQGTFSGWNFSTIWLLNAGSYPSLRDVPTP